MSNWRNYSKYEKDKISKLEELYERAKLMKKIWKKNLNNLRMKVTLNLV